MNRPLEGMRVIELAQLIAGPYCSHQLAALGAEVIKIEPPGTGDFYRGRGGQTEHIGAGFLLYNSNKKSITLNLKSARGVELVNRLLEKADVLVENYAAGALEGFGLGYDDLAPRFPRLVYASCKAYARTSRMARLGGLDFTVQASSGITSQTGYADRPGVRATAALVDTGTGMHLVAGVLAALLMRERTGVGQRVEVAMLDVCIPAVSPIVVAAAEGFSYQRMGNRHPSACPCNTFAAADGEMMVYCLTDHHWDTLARVMERGDLADDPRCRTLAGRLKIIDEIEAAVTNWTSHKSRDELTAALIEAGIPGAPVRIPDEIAADEELERRDVLKRVEFPNRGPVRVLGSALKLSAMGEVASARPPLLGEHTAEVLGTIGIGGAEIEDLRRDRVI